MKIIELRAENVKRLKAVAIRPSGAVVELSGRNAQGKTSVLDSIWWALGGGRNIQAQPIRKGCEKAVIRLDLGELIVTRTFTADDEGGFTTSLRVEKGDGSRFSRPQEILDALIGELSFDPLAFTRMAPKEQFDALRKFVPDIDFDAIDAANKRDFDARTDVNRTVKSLQAQASAISLPEGEKPARIDDSAVADKMARAADHNAAIAEKQNRKRHLESHIASTEQEIARLQRIIEAARQNLAEIGDTGDPLDVTELRAQLAKAADTNKVVDAFERRDKLLAEVRSTEAKADELTKAMDARTKAKADAVAAAKMPVNGLTFGDGALILNGEPFDQASDAEQLRASIAIAAALNPQLRVIRVRDGSRIDQDGMEQLAAYAEQHDLQIWIETVESPRGAAVLIEDGQVRQPSDRAAADGGEREAI